MKKSLGFALGSLLLFNTVTTVQAGEVTDAIVCNSKNDSDIVAQALSNFIITLDVEEIKTVKSLVNKQLCWYEDIMVPQGYVSLSRKPLVDGKEASHVVIEVPAFDKGTRHYAVIFEEHRVFSSA